MAAPQPQMRPEPGTLTRDPLTGLPTGAQFERVLDDAFLEAAADRSNLCILYIRLDRFRYLNLWLGFSAGDAALKECARRLEDCVVETGPSSRATVARMGGDEFACLVQGLTPDLTPQLAKEIVEELRLPIQIGAHPVYLTCSVGLLPAAGTLPDARAALRSAAAAASRARRNGGCTFVKAPCSDAPDLASHFQLVQALRQSLRCAELAIRFQPQVDRLCKLDGFEVLVCWNHPELGAVDPDVFIRLAEKAGLIQELGEWVLRETCLQLARWRKEGLLIPKVAVNVSPIQFASPEFVGRVLSILEETGVPGDCLEFEITENAVLRDLDESARRMCRLREHGISFAIDDFGVGYSPLTYLHRLPVDTVKVDRSFTGEIAKHGGSLPLVHTITVLAHQRGLKVVAEGVETENELEMVRAARCDRMQGFLFGCPLPAEEVKALLGTTNPLGPEGDQPIEERLF